MLYICSRITCFKPRTIPCSNLLLTQQGYNLLAFQCSMITWLRLKPSYALTLQYSGITWLTHPVQQYYMSHSSHTAGLPASLIPYSWITCLTHSIRRDYMPHSSHAVGLHASPIPSRRITCLTHHIQWITCFTLKSSQVIVSQYSRITGPSNKSSHNLAFRFLTTARLAKGHGHELGQPKSCIHYK